MFGEQPDSDLHGECATEIRRLKVALLNLTNAFHEGRAGAMQREAQGYIDSLVYAAEQALACAVQEPSVALRVAARTAWLTGTDDFRRHYDEELFKVLGITCFQDLYEPTAGVQPVHGGKAG